MRVESTSIEGMKKLNLNPSNDLRGKFVKIYNEDIYSESGISLCIREQYSSISNKGVIRGMHFQLPPYDCDKLVTVIDGSVIDVVLDLRKNSSTYLKWQEVMLCKEKPEALFIPKGCAHGFLALEDQSCMLYNVSSVYNADFDAGILWNSFGYEWRETNPLMSSRDQKFPRLEEFNNPFNF